MAFTLKQLSLNQERVIATLLIVIGIAALGLQARAVLNRIRAPFMVPQTHSLAGVQEDLVKDTDGEGILDVEELNIYHTSPYLADTDGDGITDNAEIARGTDPNCAEGKTCVPTLGLGGTPGAEQPAAQPFGGLLDVPNPQNTPTAAQRLVAGNFSASELRTYLEQTGTPKNALDALTDDELLSLYQQLISQQQNAAQNLSSTNTATPANAHATTTIIDAAQLEQMSPGELRNFLRVRGIAVDVLAKISDGDLLAAAKEALNEISTTSSTLAASDTSSTITLDTLQQRTPGELRNFLRAHGIPTDVLEKISDEDLKTEVEAVLKGSSVPQP